MPDVPPKTKSKAEKLADNSHTLGVFSILCGITALPAMIQAIRALICIRKEGGNKTAFRLAMFGLIFPSCVLGAIAFFALGALGAARDMTYQLLCVNNLKEIALTARLYENDRPGFCSLQWCDVVITNNSDLLQRNMTYAKLLHCPATSRAQRCSYALNRQLIGVKDLSSIPSDTVLFFDSDAGWNAVGGPEIASLRHQHGLNVACADGSVRQVQFKDINTLHWNPYMNSPAK